MPNAGGQCPFENPKSGGKRVRETCSPRQVALAPSERQKCGGDPGDRASSGKGIESMIAEQREFEDALFIRLPKGQDMVRRTSRRFLSALFVCLAIAIPAAPSSWANTPLQDAISKLTPEQQAVLKAYEAARLAFERKVDQYWRTIELKRKRRLAKLGAGKPVTAADYVKEQPPVYDGPKRPADIMALLPKPPPPPPDTHTPVPVVTDFLREAVEVYGFTPERVSEDEFMIYYAIEAIRMGLTRDQVVRVYALETGGMGTHDLQSGYNPRTGHAASTALGYAQLLAANSIEQIRKDGEEFASRLERLAADERTPESKAEALRRKAACLRRMLADARKIRDSWPAHVAYAKTPQGLGMHALNLDGDIGPWMQVVKLRGIKEYAAKKGMDTLTGAQLELMNLAGPARGFEMMQPIARDMPTSNFFERGGYERNPVVHGKTGAELLVKFDEIMDRNVQKPGAERFATIFDGIARRLASDGQLQALSR